MFMLLAIWLLNHSFNYKGFCICMQVTVFKEFKDTFWFLRTSNFFFRNLRTSERPALRNRCRDDGVVQQPPLPQQTFFELLHIMDLQTVDSLLKDTPDAVVHRIQIWRIGWPLLLRDKIWHLSLPHGVTCTVNGMISVTSTLRHQVRMYMARNVINLPV